MNRVTIIINLRVIALDVLDTIEAVYRGDDMAEIGAIIDCIEAQTAEIKKELYGSTED